MAVPRRSAVRWTPGSIALALLAMVVAACSRPGGTELGVLASGERMPEGITVTSTAFEAGAPVPERFSCEGDNVPPPLDWTGVPSGARELAIVIEDPDAPDGIFVQWLVVGIDSGATGLRGPGPPSGSDVLPGSSDNPTYIGPCPPNGDPAHRYVFEVYALPRSPSLDPASSPLEKVRAIRKEAVAGGSLTGTFAR